MKDTFLRFIFLALCFYASASFAAGERSNSIPKDYTTRMDQTSVVEIAKRAALAEGVKLELERYQVEDIWFEFWGPDLDRLLRQIEASL